MGINTRRPLLGSIEDVLCQTSHQPSCLCPAPGLRCLPRRGRGGLTKLRILFRGLALSFHVDTCFRPACLSYLLVFGGEWQLGRASTAPVVAAEGAWKSQSRIAQPIALESRRDGGGFQLGGPRRQRLMARPVGKLQCEACCGCRRYRSSR